MDISKYDLWYQISHNDCRYHNIQFFSLNVTSSEHIAHGNCGVGHGLDSMSPHEPTMIAAMYMYRRESLVFLHCISEPAHLHIDGDTGCVSVVDSEGSVKCQQRWSFLAVSRFWDWFWALGLVPAGDCDAFLLVLDSCIAFGLIPGGHPHKTCCDED